jgi:DNA-directed RNA polymerase subunit RPC12/RpoP
VIRVGGTAKAFVCGNCSKRVKIVALNNGFIMVILGGGRANRDLDSSNPTDLNRDCGSRVIIRVNRVVLLV